MSDFRIADALPQDCATMAKLMRDEHREAYLSVGCKPYQELRDKFEQSSITRAWFVDARLAGIYGVTGSSLSPVGFVWMAVTQEAMRYPIEMVKEARSQLSQIMMVKSELQSTILVQDKRSIKFAQILGFTRMEMKAPEGVVYIHLLRGAY